MFGRRGSSGWCQGGISVTFVDDSNNAMSTVEEVVLSLDETVRFDALSGQLIHPGKVVGWATTQQLKDQIAALEVYGKRAPVSSNFRLVGTIMVPDGQDDGGVADSKVAQAIMRLRRLARVPGGAATRAEVATILAAPLITTGMDVNFPAEDKVNEYIK